VPVERVRLGTEQVRDTEQVGRDVRHEEIEVDGAGPGEDGTDRRR
jgi:stress response protein YsnF